MWSSLNSLLKAIRTEALLSQLWKKKSLGGIFPLRLWLTFPKYSKRCSYFLPLQVKNQMTCWGSPKSSPLLLNGLLLLTGSLPPWWPLLSLCTFHGVSCSFLISENEAVDQHSFYHLYLCLTLSLTLLFVLGVRNQQAKTNYVPKPIRKLHADYANVGTFRKYITIGWV